MITIEPLGDSALVVRLAREVGADPAQTLDAVLGVAAIIREVGIDAVCDVTPAYATVGVFYDATRIDDAVHAFEILKARLTALLASSGKPSSSRVSTLVEIPVCYDADFAVDLERVAKHTQRSNDEVISGHSDGQYFVHCIGFMPGFPYLGGLSAALATPRLATPRTIVPAGSVAIGGNQTGIYPQQAPGGWNIIGRTPIQLFDVAADPPALLGPGDRIRFRRIPRDEFESMAERR